jgi:glyoxylase-like metal-dependent hydrolase (beta-lactamase superfamily II)
VLRQVADGVLIHTSGFMQSNAVVVQGRAGVLLIDPGVTGSELDCLAGDLRELGRPVVAGFSTHPHWDHLLWRASLGESPRYGTARCAATVRDRLPDAAAKARVTAMIPADIADQVPLDLLGVLTGLPADAAQVPWDGPQVRIIEHHAHAPGHAALLIEDRGVLVAGDMLSDVLIPMLDLNAAADPIEDYLAALRLLDGVAGTSPHRSGPGVRAGRAGRSGSRRPAARPVGHVRRVAAGRARGAGPAPRPNSTRIEVSAAPVPPPLVRGAGPGPGRARRPG